MGAGIINAHALLQADFDLGRAVESAPQPDDAPARAIIAVQSLVMEEDGPAPLEMPLDWTRYGSEIAHSLLRARSEPPSISPSLAGVLAANPLKARFTS